MSTMIESECRRINGDFVGSDVELNPATNCGDRRYDKRRNSVSESSDGKTDLNDDSYGHSSCSGTEHRHHTDQWSTCRKRKLSRPQKSASKNDPSFRGVTFSVETRMSDNKTSTDVGPKVKTQLLIKSFFSVQKAGGVRCPSGGGGWHRKKYSLDLDSNSSGSDQETPASVPPFIKQHPYPEYIPGLGKMCASCGTRRTPLWRDAEDGTPLCNACGIRYKKYRVRCVYCWHIPKKDGKSYPNCTRCGDVLRVTLPRRAQYF